MDSLSSDANYYAITHPGTTILDEGFGVYSIAGYDTYAFLYTDYKDPTSTKKGIGLTCRIGYQQMSILFVGTPESFDQNWPTVQKMIDSIKITGIR